MQSQLARIECPASFACFAGAILAGKAASAGAEWLARQGFKNAHPVTQETASTVVGISAFWLVGGLAWTMLARRGV